MAIAPALLERPENRILQLCALGTQKHSEFPVVLGKVGDWENLVERIHFHRLSLFFLHHLRGHEHLVPQDVLLELQENADKILHWNLFLLTELQQIKHQLTSQGVRVLAYKGPALAYSAYGTVALRRFVDLDLLVSPKDRTKALAILQKSGYEKSTTATAFTPYLRRIKAQTDYETSLWSQEEKAMLDIHWAIAAPFESFPLSFEQLWKRRAAIGFIPDVESLCGEDLIIALCFHGLKHSWETLEWIGCLRSLIQRNEGAGLNWQFIEETAASSGCQRILYLGLRLASDLDDSQILNSIPDELRRKIEDDVVVDRMARQIWERALPRVSRKRHRQRAMLEDYVLRFSQGVQARRGWRPRQAFAQGMMRIGLLSLENSRVALKIAGPVLRVLDALAGGTTKFRSL